MSHLWQAATGQRLPLQTAGYRPGDRMPQGSAISTLSVSLRHTGLEPDFGSPLGASDARIASSAGQPGSADFVSQACGSAANVPHIGVSGPDLSALRHLVRIATEYQIQDFDVFSIRLKTHCPVGAKPSVEI